MSGKKKSGKIDSMENWKPEQKGGMEVNKIIKDLAINNPESLMAKYQYERDETGTMLEEFDHFLPSCLLEPLEEFDRFKYRLKKISEGENKIKKAEVSDLCSNIILSIPEALDYFDGILDRCNRLSQGKFESTGDLVFDSHFRAEMSSFAYQADYYIATLNELKDFCLEWIQQNT